MGFWKSLKSQTGVAASEYMLVVSVVVVGAAAAGYTFVPTFNHGVNDLANDVSSILKHGDIGSVADAGDLARGGDQSTDTQTGGGNQDAPPPAPCSGTVVVNCSGQHVGTGGGGADTTTGASTTAVATLQNAADHTATEVADARAEVLANVQANCSQVFLASVTGQHSSTVTVNTVTNGLTVPDTMSIHIPFFGINIGNIPTAYKGFMSLDQMQQYLASQGMAATVKNGASLSDISGALADGQRVGVIIDADDNGNPRQGCGGQCGHTVKVLGVTDTTVTIRDKNGTRQVPRSDFDAAWQAQHGGMIAVTPRSSPHIARR